MFYAIALMLVMLVLLLVFDHTSLYSLLFVLMFLGATIAFFFMIQHLAMFADYGPYKDTNRMIQIDWRVFQYTTSHLALPLVWKLRLINFGITVFLLGTTLFNLEFSWELQRKKTSRHTRRMYSLLLLLLPVLSMIIQDPIVSTRMYLLFHTNCSSQAVYIVYRVAEAVYKAVILVLLMRPVFLLMHAVAKSNVFFLKLRLWLFSIGMLLANSTFFLFFYLGECGISVDTVIRSGFWIFHTLDGVIPFSYIEGSVVIFLILSVNVFNLLSCQMDVLLSPVTERKIQKNITTLNEALGETLHSQKNLFFSMQILMGKIERATSGQDIPEVERLQQLIGSSLTRTSDMLDTIRSINHQSDECSMADIVTSAIEKIHVPDFIHLHWHPEDSKDVNTAVMVNAYSMEHVMINVLMNAVEAIENAGKEKGSIRVEVGSFLRWVVITVLDNGCGISRKEKSKLFSPHYSGKKGRMNWGLGLSYAFRVVRAHMGQIRIDSQPGVYTHVVIMLPGITRRERRR